MAIYAKNTESAQRREPLQPGMYAANCFAMYHIGTVEETFEGETKKQNKVMIGWEIPEETYTYKDEEKPVTLFKEYTLSMHDKAGLRKMLKGWRGKDFTPEEAKQFDVTNLLGIPCLLNILQKPSKADASKIYEEIAGVMPLTKSTPKPPKVNPIQELNYDAFNQEMFNTLPNYIQEKFKRSAEFQDLISSGKLSVNQEGQFEEEDQLPF